MLCKNTAEKLKFLQIKDENINAINSKNLGNLDNIIEEYKDIFEGIGKLKCFDLTLHINKSVPPVAQHNRKIPHNLRQKLLEKLIELEENDIIEKSRWSYDMTSPLIIVPKRDGDIRIIFDMRVANQPMKRERHPIPTVEEIVQEMRGACHFSKLRFMLRIPWFRTWCSIAKSNFVFNTFWVWWTQNVTLGITTASGHYQQTLERNIFYDLQNVCNISDDVIIWERVQKNQNLLQGSKDLYLQQFNCEIKYKKGTENSSNTLSRPSIQSEIEKSRSITEYVNFIIATRSQSTNIDEIRQIQMNDTLH